MKLDPAHAERVNRADPVDAEGNVIRLSDEAGKLRKRKRGNETLLTDWNGRQMLEDSPLSEYLAQLLRPTWRFVPGIGWLNYEGGRWQRVAEVQLTTEIQGRFTALFVEEARTAESDRRRRLVQLLANTKIRAVQALLRGLLLVDGAQLDAHPHLLNCQNGIVDLRTGRLMPHDSSLMMTKITACKYVSGATHPDWDAALAALPDRETAAWLQSKLGQAITGLPPSDDILPVLYGKGENGKSTFLGCRYALGSYAQIVPERLLTARPSDHPTELMTLRGTRLAVLEELPEGPFNVRRLKAILGTSQITARYTGADNVTWNASHTLVLSTNYRPRIYDSDHGTWRRLALVTFPYRFRSPDKPLDRDNDKHGDGGLRERIERGDRQREAVLAWLVAGAMRCYPDGSDEQRVPTPSRRVRDDTAQWRGQSDLFGQFAEERLVFDPNASVLSNELFDAFSSFQASNGHAQWSDQTFSEKVRDHDLASAHGLEKVRVRTPKGLSRPPSLKNPQPPASAKVSVWKGVRFRKSGE